jgi:hypothetical protein
MDVLPSSSEGCPASSSSMSPFKDTLGEVGLDNPEDLHVGD